MALTHLSTFPAAPTTSITSAEDLWVKANGEAYFVPGCTAIDLVNITLTNESKYAKDFETAGLGPGSNAYVALVSGGGTTSVPDRIAGTLPVPVSTVRTYWKFTGDKAVPYYFPAVESTTWSTKKPVRV